MINASASGARIAHISNAVAPEVTPTLMFSFEDNLNEARGLLTMVTGGNPGLGQQQDPVTYTDSDTPATLGRSVVSTLTTVCWASNDSSVELCLGTEPFTFEGVCRINTGETGGTVASKNWYDAQPADFQTSWSIEIGPAAMRFSWQTTTVGLFPVVSETSPPLPFDRDFTWAVTDDGISLRFYLDGALILTDTSVAGRAAPPFSSSDSRVTLFGALSGFAGITPNLGGGGFVGRVALFRYYKGTCKYTGSSMPALTDPAVV